MIHAAILNGLHVTSAVASYTIHYFTENMYMPSALASMWSYLAHQNSLKLQQLRYRPNLLQY